MTKGPTALGVGCVGLGRLSQSLGEGGVKVAKDPSESESTCFGECSTVGCPRGSGSCRHLAVDAPEEGGHPSMAGDGGERPYGILTFIKPKSGVTLVI